ncbi:putative RNA-directed DNA polymerase [Helianthus annuus]|nr:putative RNA-directed DNA polymerase [Helianthus annuus]
MSTEELMGILQSHELRMKLYDDVPMEHAFQMQNANVDRSGQAKGRGKNKGKSWGSIRCYSCQKLGHTAKFCPKKEGNEKSDNALIHKEDELDEQQDDTMFMIFNMEEMVKEDCWYLDSGCSNHMTGNNGMFVKLDESLQKEVRTGDDKRLEVQGIGEVMISIKGQNKKVKNVFYVKGLKHNLLSVGQLLQKGYKVEFLKEQCIIKDMNNRVIGVIKMTNNKMFPLNPDNDISLALSMTSTDTSTLWHERFGHVNFDTLVEMGNKELVRGIPKITKNLNICEGCISGKHARKPFPKKSMWQTDTPLQIVHSDICGPMKTESIGGCRYFITFIDDFTRKTWVYFLKLKSEALSYFKQFRALVENQSDHKIKTLRSDRGGEYCSKVFQEYLGTNGIYHQLTNSYTPQQNGVAKRKNRTLMELSRSMLNMKKLPNSYWAEAVACTTYILNQTITKTRPNVTPYEAWNGRKPSVGHFKVFGCLAYVHVLKQHRSKLDIKTEKNVFVGYNTNTKGYKLYNPLTNKITISRDVIFDERKTWVPESDSTSTPFLMDDGDNRSQSNPEITQEISGENESAAESVETSNSHLRSENEVAAGNTEPMNSHVPTESSTGQTSDSNFSV